MKRNNWIVTEKSVRPAGRPDECFYCNQKIGSEHKKDCVIRSKTVVVDFTIRTVMAVPEFWDEEFINFRLNERSWCVDNILPILEKKSEHSCLCMHTESKFIREATEDDEEDWGITFVKDLES